MNLPVVVLAGGLATRLYPITTKIPKSIILINDIPFVHHQLKLFFDNGLKHIHFCLGNLGEMVEECIRATDFFAKMQITFSYDGEKLLGTGGAILKALPLLPETFFVTYGDSYLNIDYKNVGSHFLKNNDENSGLMMIYRNKNKFDKSNVIYKNDRIVRYSKSLVDPEMEYIDYGLCILRKTHFNGYTTDRVIDLAEVLENLSVTGKLTAVETYMRFYEIGSKDGIEDLKHYLLNKQK